jgi:hypothetical protein
MDEDQGRRAYDVKYYATHREAVLARNRETAKQSYARQVTTETPEERAQRLERNRAYGARFRERHREQVRAKSREGARRRRAKAKGAPVDPQKREAERARKRVYYEEHREERLAYIKRWQEENRDKVRAKQRRYSQRNAVELAAYQAAYRASPEGDFKIRARRALYNAVARGKVVKPDHCERCGQAVSGRKLHGHHHRGYEHPLDVQWLCTPCHGKEHRT